MTNSRLWSALPQGLAELLDQELAAVADEIVLAIGKEVPGYARPVEGAFGRGLRAGVTEALGRFLGSIRDRDSTDPSARRVYVALGRQEYTAGRTLDALQAAYRVGARVAWRRFARAGHASGFSQQTMADLAEAMFAYIDELSAESVEGYAQAQAEHAGELQRSRAELLAALLAEPGVVADRTALATGASWPLPHRVAALACSAEALPGVARRLGSEALHAEHVGLGCALLPDADGPGRRDAIRLAARDTRVAIGPAGAIEDLPRSWRLASGALSVSDAQGLVVADDHLAELVLLESQTVVERIGERRLRALRDLTPAAGERMARTALAFVQMQGNAAAMARALNVHPQTARYRIARLRELLGPQLQDPAARFELEAALRHRLKGAEPG
jgi:PucR C-terminal helix-turn-helix domain